MKIAVIGAGAIGSLVVGYLKLKGEDISLVGHSSSVKAIQEKGLEISGVRGNFRIDKIDISEKLHFSPDLIILTTKTQDIKAALENNSKYISANTTIITTQNGISAEDIVAEYLPKEKIVSSIVMFGSTFLEPTRIVHNFEGSWVLGSYFNNQDMDEKIRPIGDVLQKAFPIVITREIKGMKYLKIFINANNCIAAVLGVSMQEAFGDIEVSRIGMSVWREGVEVINKAGIKLVSLPDFPLERFEKLNSLPLQEAAKIYSQVMVTLSQEPLYGSILQSIKRDRPSEIDYINGEFINLARENNISAPLNEMLVGMVHQVESTKKFFTREDLLKSTREFLN